MTEVGPELKVRQHTISALVQNESGTINRIVSMFRRRGFSLASFNAGDCEEPGFSRVTFVIDADDNELAQCLRQLEKVIDVVEVEDLKQEQSVGTELALIRLRPEDAQRDAIYQVVQKARAWVPKSTAREMVVEFTGGLAEIESLIASLQPYGIVEIVRTGLVAIKVEG
ncbi:acetolactate synthase small subunit [bacterium]|nr:MAG: acetolactate synthase small subunit [bacterium]